MSIINENFDDYTRETGECYYRAVYPGGVVVQNHYNYSEKARIIIFFKVYSTVKQIDYAVRMEKQRLQDEKQKHIDEGFSEEEAIAKVVEDIGDIDWGYGLIMACNELVDSDCFDKVNYFLDHGADPEWTPDYEWGGECLSHSPLLVACSQGHLPLVKRLLQAGAKPTKEHLREALSVRPCSQGRARTDVDGNPLSPSEGNYRISHTSSSEANQVIELLLTLVSPDSSDEDEWHTTLMDVVYPKNHYAKALLIERGYA